MKIEDNAVVQPETPAVRVALEFVRTLEGWGDAASFLTDDAIEEELPNRIFAKGATRDLAAMKASMAKGKDIFRAQSYAIQRAFGQADVAVLELEWIGELAIPLGKLAAGEKMRVRGAFVFELREGKIARIRHYDCFDAF
jgi:hypothetical protein